MLKRVDYIIKGIAITALALFVISIVLIGLTQARYIHPIIPLCSFASILPVLLILKGVDMCRRPIADRYGLTIKAYDQTHYPPPPKKESDSDSD